MGSCHSGEAAATRDKRRACFARADAAWCLTVIPGRGTLLAVLALTASVAAQRTPADGDLADRLSRIGERVRDYYSRAQSIICKETVHLQSLGPDMAPDGPPRRLVYELRIAWEPAADGRVPKATVQRELLLIGGRPPRPGQEPGCTDPRSISPEPLAMFLPERRHEFAFTWAGTSRMDSRPTVTLAYRPAVATPPAVSWEDDCVSVDLPGLTRGRAWADAETGDILRLDESLMRTFEFPVPRDLQRRTGAPATLAVERADTSIRYRPVKFTDPDETVILPASVDSLTVFRRTGTPRLRTTQVFSEYRRFLTSGRVIH